MGTGTVVRPTQTGTAVPSAVVVPDYAVVPGAFAPGDLPAKRSCPGQPPGDGGSASANEAELMLGQFLKEGNASVAPIKEVDHPLLLPPLGALGQQRGGLRWPTAGQGVSAGPAQIRAILPERRSSPA